MARIARNKKVEQPKHRCSECAHSYDPHSPAIDGHMILCRCKLDKKTEYGKWSKLLNDRACEHFTPKEME